MEEDLETKLVTLQAEVTDLLKRREQKFVEFLDHGTCEDDPRLWSVRNNNKHFAEIAEGAVKHQNTTALEELIIRIKNDIQL